MTYVAIAVGFSACTAMLLVLYYFAPLDEDYDYEDDDE